MTSPYGVTSLQSVVAKVLDARSNRRPIRATYRLQFNHEFTFAHATRLVPYLRSLGISHMYASPISTASPGSMHGYDVVDYGQINPEIGTREEFDQLVATLHDHEMGLVVDFVPNHMGIEKGANAWWQDVLQNGRMSRYAEYFDIDWHPLKFELRGKVLLPFLGDHYGAVLERGELQLAYDAGSFAVHYWDTPFPVNPVTYPSILARVHTALNGEIDADDIDALELESIITAFDRLDVAGENEPMSEAVEARHREQTVTMRRLADLIERNNLIRESLESVIAQLNGTAGFAASFDELDNLLMQQPYRLSFWRVASEEINYRRFFAINTLAAIRQESREVFAASHELLMELLVSGAIDGVRFDHPDGLWDPERYFHDFQVAFTREAVRKEIGVGNDDGWQATVPELTHIIRDALQGIAESDREWPVWTVAEKILEHGEVMPRTWKIDGTVGYEFMQAATGVLVNPASRALFDTIYSRFTGEKIRFNELVYEMKLWQVREAFASELNVLTNVANRISESDRHSRDFTFNSLRTALREIIANFHVYRTYTTCREGDVTEGDVITINAAVDEAIRRNPRLDPSVFNFLRNALLLHHTGETEERRYAPCQFAMKLQQLSGPVMAKGLEDTTFYRFNRLTSLNEVGGDPARFGTSVSDFHKQNQARLSDWPTSMINSSTHDTKRSEDVRAAINVLSERPTEWRAALNRWTRLNRKFKVKIDNALAPNRIDDWVLYQTLVGTWPVNGPGGIDAVYVSRMQEYIVKVVREAGRFSNWVNPNEPYETALRDFVAGVLNTRRNRTFVKDIEAFVAAQRDATFANALSQQVLKLTSPGIPDIYQGTELWDDSLVDPDNRRPVDYDHRQQMVSDYREMEQLIDNRADGEIKLELTRKLLQHRSEFPEMFARGDYAPVRVSGLASDHVIAFLREHQSQKLLVIVPRLLFTLAGNDSIFASADMWQDTVLQLPAALPTDGWTNLFSGDLVDNSADIAANFAHMPIAILTWQGSAL